MVLLSFLWPTAADHTTASSARVGGDVVLVATIAFGIRASAVAVGCSVCHRAPVAPCGRPVRRARRAPVTAHTHANRKSRHVVFPLP